MDGARPAIHRSMVLLAGRETNRQDNSRSIERGRSRMSTGLNLESVSRSVQESLTSSELSGAASAIAASHTGQAELIAPPAPRVPRFGQVLSPERALHQSIISLADQAVASATNFLTGIIIARTCS